MGESKRRKQALGSAYGKPRPVPIWERSPKPSDCDELGWCWAWNDLTCSWEYVLHEFISCEPEPFTHWLPVTAIPNPRPTAPNWQEAIGSHTPES